MPKNNTSGGIKPAVVTAVQGSSPVTTASFEASVAAAIVPTPGAVLPGGQTLLPVVPPNFMNRGGMIDHSSIVPTEFCRLYSQIITQSDHTV
jgi:hypothetical protein